MAHILVTGGASNLGADIVRELLARGDGARILSSREHATVPEGAELAVGDLREGSGLDAALAGVTTIIHCASDAREPGFATEIQGARNLSERAAGAGVTHLIYISIVGVERSDWPYYVAKREAERIFEAGVTPWTILRATQFHDLVYGLLRGADSGAGSVRLKPNMRFQSVAREELAARLIELAKGAPAGYAPPMRGPETLSLETMAAAYLAALGRADVPETLPPDDAPPSPFQTGVNLVSGATPATMGRQTWAEYLRLHANRAP